MPDSPFAELSGVRRLSVRLLADPVNLQPDVPKAFRDASELLHRHGAKALVIDELDRLIPCFSTVPSARVQREVRSVLNAEESSSAKVGRLRDLARELGLRPPEPIEALAAIEEDEVHLVAWMAVQAGGGTVRRTTPSGAAGSSAGGM